MSSIAEVKTLKVFLVENHPDTLQSLKLYLEDLGHEVQTAMTVAQALASLPKADCNVLICDIGLPDGTGWEVLQKAEIRSSVFAVAMSGFGMNADNARSRAAGFRHHLLKPFKAAELDKIMAEALAELSKD